MSCRLLVLLAVAFQSVAEPAPRLLTAVPLQITAPPAYVSAVHELRDGRLLVSNARGPSLHLLDPATGTVTPIGTAGGGADRYARPGGLYPGRNGAILMIDRAQTRAVTISPSGAVQGSRPIARKGVTSSSSDIDLQRLDAAGLVYFVERRTRPQDLTGGTGVAEAAILRLDPETQTIDEIATVRGPEQRVIPGGDGMIFTRGIIGSPADGWGVAPDGRVAVVRASPYRVEWHAGDGKVTSGPVIEHPTLSMTEADKEHFRSTRGGGASVGMAGGGGRDGVGADVLFAPTRAPFAPSDVWVSPEGRVWVERAAPAGSTTTTFDVFDASGRRVDRVAVPIGGQVVGFGQNAVYLRYNNPSGAADLRKYRVK